MPLCTFCASMPCCICNYIWTCNQSFELRQHGSQSHGQGEGRVLPAKERS
uniref:Uncharacterized protein n=1 Tax=Rhizophora mucronata TaxID=61149 RepID=A0A2P2MYW7_RHIMU